MPDNPHSIGPLVDCDVSELVNLPKLDGESMAELRGSARQVDWAHKIREDCLNAWESDLTEGVFEAIQTITDATWWIANKDNDSFEIKWPRCWTQDGPPQVRPPQPAPSRPPAAPSPPSRPPPPRPSPPPAANKPVDPHALDQFEQFARKVCRSPELSYLTMMALLYRQTKDATVRTHFDEVRSTVNAHLKAIDEIANT